MKHVIVSIALYVTCSIAYGQEAVYPQGQVIKFSFFEGTIADTSRLVVSVRYTNGGKVPIFIPAQLKDGPLYDLFGNMHTEMEVWENNKYVPYRDKTVDYFYGDSTPPRPKNHRELKPGTSATRRFNLISRAGFIYKGKYRMRVHVLKIPINDPPRIEMQYITSRWFYFTVTQDMTYPNVYPVQ
jgi:hypothetical protein